MNSNIVIYITIVILILCILNFAQGFTNQGSGLITVKSTYDGNTYLVRDLSDKVAAANMLAKLREQMNALVVHMHKANPTKKTKRMIQNYIPENICETSETSNFTSYNINKGQKIVFCIRQKGTNEILDFNTLYFVALHELTHIITKSLGHKQEFWDNFKEILKFAIDNKYYTYVAYADNPKKYCGIMITDTPYHINSS
jgi:hypothetical protein